MYNLEALPTRPKYTRIRMEATTPSGRVAVVYNQNHHELLRIALALKASHITLSDVH